MSEQLNPQQTAAEHSFLLATRQALGRAGMAAALVLSGGAVAFGVESAVVPSVAYANSIDDALGAYPDKSMPCEHAPYNVTGSCTNYDWGPTHTEKYDDPSELSSRGYAYRNCTDWVAYRESTLAGVTVPKNLGAGGQWAMQATADGIATSTSPAAWDAAVKPATYDARGKLTDPGHVAFVESISSDGASMTISEYNHDKLGNGDQQTIAIAGSGFTKFVDFGVHPSPNTGSSPSLPDGSFISYNPDVNPNDPRKVYEIVGGAPLYVSGDDAARMPGWKTAQQITAAQWMSLRQYPKDGTFISNVQNGGVYEIVGGAPLYVSGQDAQLLPGWKTAEVAPGWDFANYEHLRPYPADGTFVSNVQNGMVYEIAGGAPLYVAADDAASLPGWKTAERVPHWDFANRQDLRAFPADGTYITDDINGKVSVVAGGAPLYVANWNDVGGPRPTTVVGDWAIANQLLSYPQDGTLVRGFASGEEFQTQSGTATRITTQPLPPATIVDDWAIINQLGATE